MWFCEHYRALTTMFLLHLVGSIYNVCSLNASTSTIKGQIGTSFVMSVNMVWSYIVLAF